MNCCGNRIPASAEPATQSSPWTSHSGIRIEYLAQSPILVHGPVSGKKYQFSGGQSIQIVDLADAPHLLRTRYFRAL